MLPVRVRRGKPLSVEAVDVDELLDRHRDRLRALLRDIVEEELGDNPFTLPLDDFLARTDDERAALVRRAAHVARARVDRELEERGAAWIVLVGEDVVMDSTERAALPTVDEVVALGRAQNRVPYLFEAALIEEIPALAE